MHKASRRLRGSSTCVREQVEVHVQRDHALRKEQDAHAPQHAHQRAVGLLLGHLHAGAEQRHDHDHDDDVPETGEEDAQGVLRRPVEGPVVLLDVVVHLGDRHAAGQDLDATEEEVEYQEDQRPHGEPRIQVLRKLALLRVVLLVARGRHDAGSACLRVREHLEVAALAQGLVQRRDDGAAELLTLPHEHRHRGRDDVGNSAHNAHDERGLAGEHRGDSGEPEAGASDEVQDGHPPHELYWPLLPDPVDHQLARPSDEKPETADDEGPVAQVVPMPVVEVPEVGHLIQGVTERSGQVGEGADDGEDTNA
mmetsp:Transcript_92084/g.237621  ORF Transcript_92084/g.237621 Transcript_92084/m.237621 type:complete len:309 (+) Transcript_92084:297-1223(+)